MQKRLSRILSVSCFRKFPGVSVVSNYFKIIRTENEYPLRSTGSRTGGITQKSGQVKTATSFNICLGR